MFNKINIGKIAASVLQEISEKTGKDRQQLECVKADTDVLTEEDKKSILNKYTKYGWDIEDAVKDTLKDRYRKEAKLTLAKELFPEFFKEESKETD